MNAGGVELQGSSKLRCFAAILLAIVMCVGTLKGEEAAASHDGLNIVMTDEFDAGTEHWTYSDLPVTSMEWDSTDGSPNPGSLKLSNAEPLPLSDGFLALGRCMEAHPNELWVIELMRKKTGNVYGDCLAYVQFFSSPDCSGEGGSIGNTRPPEPGLWQEHSWGFTSFSQTNSVRAALLMSVTARAGVMSCNYDSITLYNDRAPTVTDVPTLTAAGYLIIGSLLALVGCILLARRSDLR